MSLDTQFLVFNYDNNCVLFARLTFRKTSKRNDCYDKCIVKNKTYRITTHKSDCQLINGIVER